MSSGGIETTVDAQQKAAGGCCPKLVAQCATEMIGCMIFLFTISSVVASGSAMAGLAIGGVLMVLIYMGGHVSGGHFNPAVSLGIFIRDDSYGLMDMFAYWAAQIIGGFIGVLLAMPVVSEYNLGTLNEDMGINARMVCDNGGAAWIVELLYTFLLVYTVLSVATRCNDASGLQPAAGRKQNELERLKSQMPQESRLNKSRDGEAAKFFHA